MPQETERDIVAVICRIPRPGESKTRLAGDLDDAVAAARLQHAFILDELDALASPRWDLALLLDAPRDADEEEWCRARQGGHGRPVTRVHTVGDDLARALLDGMGRLLADHRRAVIVAADVPTVGPGEVAEALAALEAGADVALGHSGDGGYYLVAMAEPHDVFTGVPMGTDAALPHTERIAAARGLVTARIGEVPDVDRLPDLRALVATLRPSQAPRTARVADELVGAPEDAPGLPRALHLELTNRCNLGCTFCLRTFVRPEPDRDLSVEEALRITDGLPDLAWVALHLNGESTLSRALVPVAGHLAARGVETVLNTNGLLLKGDLAEGLMDAGLSELRVSVPGSTEAAYAEVTAWDGLGGVLENLKAFTALRRTRDLSRPRVSVWCTGTRQAIAGLPELVELAAAAGADEVYLQRLVRTGYGVARPEHDPRDDPRGTLRARLAEAEARAAELGLTLTAPGGVSPLRSLFGDAGARPDWRSCRRPWSTAAVTAHGTVLPCCIASFAAPTYQDCALGNVLTDSWEDVFHGERYRALRRALRQGPPPASCRGCGPAWAP